MGSCEDVVHGFIRAICIACLWAVVSAQSGAEGPCDVCPSECVGKHCARYWWTTMWGFLVTLVVLTMDFWGIQKKLGPSIVTTIRRTFSISGFNPLIMVIQMLQDFSFGMAMVSNLCEVHGDEVVAPLFPWSKAQVKIIVGTGVVVNLSPNVNKEVAKSSSAFHESPQVEDFSEAVVVGAKVEDSSQYNVDLTHHGVLALLRANVLPPYDQLKILRGTSTLGMIVAAAQAIGYLYVIIVRCIQGLQVSPVEVIASCMNIVILMKVVLHNYASIGHRPLLLYLTFDEEARFIEECKNMRGFEFKTQTKEMIIICIAIGGLSLVAIYFIITFHWDSNWKCMVPIVLFQGNLVMQLIVAYGLYFGELDEWLTLFHILYGLMSFMNMVGYVWALVVSFKYWKVEKFDVQSLNYLSQVLPYIG